MGRAGFRVERYTPEFGSREKSFSVHRRGFKVDFGESERTTLLERGEESDFGSRDKESDFG